MKRPLIFIAALLFLVSCEYQDNGITSIDEVITTDYLLSGSLDSYIENTQIVRLTGKPGITTISIGGTDLSKYQPCFVLYVATGTTPETTVSSAIIKLDGMEVLNTSDFSKNSVQYTFEVCNLTSSSVITVEVRGEPDSYVNVWIEGKLKLPSEGLVAYYPFNGNAEDETINQNDGIVNNAVLSMNRFGIAERAYKFAGNDDKITIQNNAVLNSTKFSISTWINVDTWWFYNAKWIVSKETGFASGFALGVDQNNYVYGSEHYAIVFYCWTSEGAMPIYKVVPPNFLTGWKHIVATCDGTVSKIYINGIEVCSRQISGNVLLSENSMLIGATNHRTDQSFEGSIDDVRIYNKSLSENEVKELYHESGYNGITFNQDLSYGTINDIEGNSYKTITIGTQTWMAENLRTTKYNDNATIPIITDFNTWLSFNTPGYCWYGFDNITNKVWTGETTGALYNWHAVSTGKLCPSGWHVPTDNEWKQLELAVGIDPAVVDLNEAWRGEGIGGKLKEVGINNWEIPNIGATNESGFTAVPAGILWSNGFGGMRMGVNYWCSDEVSADEAYYRGFYWNLSTICRGQDPKNYAFSVRCVKD